MKKINVILLSYFPEFNFPIHPDSIKICYTAIAYWAAIGLLGLAVIVNFVSIMRAEDQNSFTSEDWRSLGRIIFFLLMIALLVFLPSLVSASEMTIEATTDAEVLDHRHTCAVTVPPGIEYTRDSLYLLGSEDALYHSYGCWWYHSSLYRLKIQRE